jgi:hypothetical protein
LLLNKEKENKDLLDRFQMLHSRAEDWEVKAQQAEGENSSVRLELLSIDTERRHLRERVDLLEKEIQEVRLRCPGKGPGRNALPLPCSSRCPVPFHNSKRRVAEGLPFGHL